MYISRKLTTPESKCATVERKALAMKWAVLELRYYLLGRSFTLLTDHTPLQCMAKLKDTKAQVTSRILALQDIHFKVQHRSGAVHWNADGLSRFWTGWSGLSSNSNPLFPFTNRSLNQTTSAQRGGCCELPNDDSGKEGEYHL